jgi:hypothetical protein
MDLRIADGSGGACGEPRLAVGAPFAETARLIGLDAPASIEPGKTLDVLVEWQVLARPTNRARPFVRLVDSRGRRWGQAETTVYPSSAWRPGERAVGLARLEVDGMLPPGPYRLDAGFTLGSAQDRLAESGPWGVAGQTQAQGGPVRLVSRSTPLAPRGLPINTPLDAAFDGVRLLGATLDRGEPRAGERVRLTLFWQNVAGRLSERQVTVALRDGSGAVLREWRGGPVDGTYPTTDWKPSEVVRDTWDIVLPAALPSGALEVAVSMAPAATGPAQYVRVGTLAVQPTEQRLSAPPEAVSVHARFVGGAELEGFDLKARRVRPGDALDLTLFWRATGLIADDYAVSLALLDEAGRSVLQQDGEPAGGRRPTSGWASDGVVEDAWRLRVPRDAPRGRLQVAIGLVAVVNGRPVLTERGEGQIVLPVEVSVE